MTLTWPSVIAGGTIADDRGGGDLRPLIVYNALEVTGWYTVIISLRDLANVTARFKLEYGRYPGGNRNCLEA
jgi:hypothetical protein